MESALPAESAGPIDARLAPVVTRFVAVLIDGIILGLPFGLAGGLMASGDAGALAGVVLALVGLGLFIYDLVLFARGKSIGKKLLHLTVVSEGNGGPIGFWRMALREWIGRWVSGTIFGLGYLWAFWDGRRQSWHDKIFGTLVIRDA